MAPQAEDLSEPEDGQPTGPGSVTRRALWAKLLCPYVYGLVLILAPPPHSCRFATAQMSITSTWEPQPSPEPDMQ